MNPILRRKWPSASFVACGLVLVLSGAPALATTRNCESLTSVAMPDATITLAQSVPAGTFTTPTGAAIANLPAFCRVALTVRPTSDSTINVEVWMPSAGWNGRMLGTGGGGYTGSIGFAALGNGLRSGFAAANTDMGTVPATVTNGTSLVGHPERWLDFGSRSTHLMTVAGKTLISAFYRRPARYAYFSGCSTGGHQGLEEAQVFPNDYDGILAGAPGHNRTHLHTAFVWNYAVAHRSPEALIPAAKLTVLNNAVRAACTGKDGGLSTDAFLLDPRECSFDPGTLQCVAGDAADCLTAAQVQTAEQYYAGLRNPRSGDLIYPGWPRGSETGWGALQGTTSPAFEGITTWALGLDYDPLSLDFDRSVALLDAVLAPTVNFMSSDLSRFRKQGGKLLLYHGYADAIVSPQDTINYYRRLSRERDLSLREKQRFARLFMVPGMGHCSGGLGPNNFDALSPLMQWVEQGVAPEQIVATKFVNNNTTMPVERTMPLCAYPKEARYKGAGDPNLAASYACVEDRNGNPRAESPGREYLAPLTIQARVEPKKINLKSRGRFTVYLTTPRGSDDLREWKVTRLEVEGASPVRVEYSRDRRTVIAHFDRSALTGFTGGEPIGEPVELMITGQLRHNGSDSLFAAGATVRLSKHPHDR